MRQGKHHSTDEPAALDPVAITLALWLGFVTLVTGLVRLSEAASIQAAHAQARDVAAQPAAAEPAFRASVP